MPLLHLFSSRRKAKLQDVLRLFLLRSLKSFQTLPDQTLPEGLEQLFKECRSEYPPSVDQMVSVLQVVVTRFSKAYLVLDVLDDFSNSRDERENLASTLRKIQRETGASILVT